MSRFIVLISIVLALVEQSGTAVAGLNASCAQWSSSRPTVAASNHYNCLSYDVEPRTIAQQTNTAATAASGSLFYTLSPFSDYTSLPSNYVINTASSLYIPTAAEPGFALQSAAPTSPYAGYIGRTFKPPFYIEASLQVQQSAQPGATLNTATTICPLPRSTAARHSWPVLWLQDAQGLEDQNVCTFTRNFSEIDVAEWYVDPISGSGYTPGQTIHDWTSDTTNTQSRGALTCTCDGNTYDVFGANIVDSTTGGGTGTATFYSNGTTTLTQTWSPSGTYSSTDNADFVLLMGSGFGWGIATKYIQVWRR